MGTSENDTALEVNELEVLEEQLRHAMPKLNPAADFRDTLRERLTYAAQWEGPPVEIIAPRSAPIKLLWGLGALALAGATFVVRRRRTSTKGEKARG